MISLSKIRKIEPKILLIGSYPPIIQSILDFDYLAGKPYPSLCGIITAFKKTTGDKPVDELNADMSSSFRGNPARKSGEDVIGANKKSERYFWGNKEVLLPYHRNLEETTENFNAKINFFLNLASARRVLYTTKITIDSLPNLYGGSIFAEETPEKHSLELYKLIESKNLFAIGPSSVGFLVPGKLKLGAIGGVEPKQLFNPILYEPGNVSIFSASGGMVNELINILSGFDKRISFALSFGGDRFPITTPKEGLLAAEKDPKTTHIIYFGELGGQDEYEIAELLKEKKVTKPVIAYIAGSISEAFPQPPQFGHAKAIAKSLDENAKSKAQALKTSGATVASSFKEFVSLIKVIPSSSKRRFQLDTKNENVLDRKKALFATTISQETDSGVYLFGKDLLEISKKRSFSYITASLMLGREITSRELEEFVNLVLKLLIDNGPLVSGAINTIVTARAGKDLVSSLTAGLLTIGKRFGGAVNEAAENWLYGVESSIDPQEFVEGFATNSKPIEGIGHKKYRIDNPDPRVAELIKWTAKLKKKKFLNYARKVEVITSNKRANLILNVDGAIAAILLDILSEKEGLTLNELKELARIEFFNAFFVIPRSVGFISHYLDQKRIDEGLFRLPKEEATLVSKI